MRSFVLVGILIALPLIGQNRATRPKIERPDGPVWEVIRRNCTACHGIDDYVEIKYLCVGDVLTGP